MIATFAAAASFSGSFFKTSNYFLLKWRLTNWDFWSQFSSTS